MDNAVKEILIQWRDAARQWHKDDYAVADDKLFSLNPGDKNLPQELRDLLIVDKDKGCDNCWLADDTREIHPECKEKMSRWLKIRHKLMDFARNL